MDHRVPADQAERHDANQKEDILRQCRLQSMYKGNTFPITGHSSSVDHTKVTRFVIDTPRDNGMHQREDLWTYQKGKRGVQVGHGDSLPAIPYRLGSREKTSDSLLGERETTLLGFRDSDIDERLNRYYFPRDGPLPRLNHHPQHSYNGNNSSTAASARSKLKHSQPFLHLSAKSEVPKVRLTSDNNGGLFITDDPKLTISQKINLSERDQKTAEKSATVQLSDRLPRPNTRAKTLMNFQIKRCVSSSEFQKRQEMADSQMDDADGIVDIPSDRIGPTSKHKSMEDTPRTLADLINRESYEKYKKLASKRQKLAERSFGHRNKPFSSENMSTNEVDQELFEKFNTRLIDGLSYDTFARTRRLVPDQEAVKSSMEKKRPSKAYTMEQTSSEFGDGFSTFFRDDSTVKKVDNLIGRPQKHSKLRISLTNNRTDF